jgi:SAM-dependent methyltransferase
MNWYRALDDMAAGYQDAAILLAAVRHRIFDALDDQPRTAKFVAEARELNPRAVAVLLHALVGMEILSQSGDGFVLATDRAELLRSDGSRTQVSILGHHQNLFQRWAHLDDVLMSGQPVPKEGRDPKALRDYISGMADLQRQSMPTVAEAIDLSGAERLIDVGGGPATASIVFAELHPQLNCTVFDEAGPLEIAREYIAEAGLEDRVETVAGNFLTDDLGQGFDVAYLSNVIHIYDEARVAGLFQRVHRALASGGRILVKDFYLDDTRSAPRFATRFAINMLVGTESGTSHVESRIWRLLDEAGFDRGATIPVAVNSAVLEGRRRPV